MATWELDVEYPFKPDERPFRLSNRLLLCSGPPNYSPRVTSALTNPPTTPVGAELYDTMDEIQVMLKYAFQTRNEFTLAIQTSGTGGLEAVLCNLVDPGEKIIVAVGGICGDRTVEAAKIRDINVIRMNSQRGEVFMADELEAEIVKHEPVLLFVTHGESSGGTLQPLEELGDICRKHNCLLAVDAIATLGGVPLFVDRWGIDVAVSASHKCLGAPPGLAYITLSSKAVERMRFTKTSPPFYYNILELGDTWNCFGNPRKYYYTYNSNLLCAARESLAEVLEEGLVNVWQRQKVISEQFWVGIEQLELDHFVERAENRLWPVCCICVPSEVDWKMLRGYLLDKYALEISAGIGPTSEIAIRIGIMGYNAKPHIVNYALNALKDAVAVCRRQARLRKQTSV